MGDYEAMCPFCKTEGRFYGLPYGLPMGSFDENEAYRTEKVILVNCDNCGAIVGVYKMDERNSKS